MVGRAWGPLSCSTEPTRSAMETACSDARQAASAAVIARAMGHGLVHRDVGGRPGQPLNGTLDVAGPDVYRLDELGRLTLAARKDARTVVTDDKAGMFAAVDADVLVAGPDARVAATRYEDWLGTTR